MDGCIWIYLYMFVGIMLEIFIMFFCFLVILFEKLECMFFEIKWKDVIKRQFEVFDDIFFEEFNLFIVEKYIFKGFMLFLDI